MIHRRVTSRRDCRAGAASGACSIGLAATSSSVSAVLRALM